MQEKKNVEGEAIHFLERLNDSPIILWLTENKHRLPYFFLGTAALIILAIKFSSGQALEKETSYLQADTSMNSLRNHYLSPSQTGDTEALFENLEKLLDRYPEMQAKYDGALAQLLLTENNTKEAIHFAERATQRTASISDRDNRKFSAITLMIAEGNLEQALLETKNLNRELEQRLKEEGLAAENLYPLYLYSIIRWAALEKRVGTPDGERLAWERWISLENEAQHPKQRRAIKSIEEVLKEGELRLSDYAQQQLYNQKT